LDDSRTRLYYTVYRNFWKHALGDVVISAMMDLTLDEDVAILKSIHPAEKLPDDPLSLIYDVTFLKYRQAVVDASC
jgi:hypothetical protein